MCAVAIIYYFIECLNKAVLITIPMWGKDSLHSKNRLFDIITHHQYYWLNVLKPQWAKLIRNVLLNSKHQDRAINPAVHTNTQCENCMFTQQQTRSFHGDCGSVWSSHVTEPERGGEADPKSVENVIFLDVWAQRNLTLWLPFTFSHLSSYKFWERKWVRERERKRERDVVETCQLPFTSTEECWRVFTMLSVSAPDKSSQFINKIDGITYHQILLCVFPYKPLCQKHPCYLTSSYPLCPSPGMLRCFNIIPPPIIEPHNSRIQSDFVRTVVKGNEEQMFPGAENWPLILCLVNNRRKLCLGPHSATQWH